MVHLERRPIGVTPLDAELLAERREVKQAGRRLERLARPAYVNTDATWRKGLAGLAYDSWALGQRIEVVACEDIVKAEHLALLMAMEDAERALSGPIAFRVDSTAVANMVVGKKPRLEEVRSRIKALLKRHPDWSLVLVEGKRNKVANNLACRPFLEEADQKAGGLGRRGRGVVVLPADMVEELCPYVYTVVGMAAHDVTRVTEEGSSRGNPELLADPRKRYEAACALLDLVGWRDSRPSTELKVDLRKHGWALGRAIEVALEVMEDTLKDFDELGDDQPGSETSPVYDATVRRAGILRDLSLAVAHYQLRVLRGRV